MYVTQASGLDHIVVQLHQYRYLAASYRCLLLLCSINIGLLYLSDKHRYISKSVRNHSTRVLSSTLSDLKQLVRSIIMLLEVYVFISLLFLGSN